MPPVTFAQYVWTWCAARPDDGSPSALGARLQLPQMADAFGVGLDEPPHPAPEPTGWLADRLRKSDAPARLRTENWHVDLHGLALHLADAAHSGRDPFSSYLEAPPCIIAAHERYHLDLLRHHADQRSAAFALLVDVLVLLHPDAAKQVC